MSEPRIVAHVWIPLSRAALCLTWPGETVFDVTDLRCPVCGDSEHFALVSPWLSERV
jgi:hypothetical protein